MKMLMCHDGSEQTDKALRFGILVAKACSATVTLLGIAESGGVDSAILLAHLQRTREELETQGIQTELISKSGPPVPEILSHGKQEDCNLVVLGAGLPDTEIPAKTYELIRQIESPVLLVVGERSSLKKILVCTGGNNAFEGAIQQTVEIARCTDAEVILLHILPTPPLIYSNLIAEEEDPEEFLNSNSPVGRNLRRQKEMIENNGVRSVVQLRHGILADEVIRDARTRDCDLIVVGSSLDRGPFYRYMLGDVTHEIVNRAECPVLIERPADLSYSDGMFRRIIRKLFGA